MVERWFADRKRLNNPSAWASPGPAKKAAAQINAAIRMGFISEWLGGGKTWGDDGIPPSLFAILGKSTGSLSRTANKGSPGVRMAADSGARC